jgi:hypothetical protein
MVLPMNTMAKKLIQAALAIGTMAGSLVVVTATPAHAATPTHIRRYSWNLSVWMSTPQFNCSITSTSGEKHMDVAFGGIAFSGANRSFTCTQTSTGNKIKVEYAPTATWDWNSWAAAHHKIHVSYTAGGTTWSCGDIGRASNQQGTVTNTFSRENSQFQISADGNRACGNGSTVSAGFQLSEGWAAIVK